MSEQTERDALLAAARARLEPDQLEAAFADGEELKRKLVALAKRLDEESSSYAD